MDKLPKPDHEYGYTPKQIKSLCRELGFTQKEFNRAFGVNTCAVGDNGELILYPRDVESALYKMGYKKLGKNHPWD